MDPQSQSGTKHQRDSAIVIIADDLTGACDSAVAFVKHGRSMHVLLDASQQTIEAHRPQGGHGQLPGLAVTTETRNCSTVVARHRVEACARFLTSAFPTALLFKKIDSAARGQLGIEISAALRASELPVALVAPAFPAVERTVSKGILTVGDCSGQNLAVPLWDLFAHLDSSNIAISPRGSTQDRKQEVERALKHGTQILLCDATTQENLETLAAAALQVERPLLWCGSAGLANALATVLPACMPSARRPTVQRSGRTLLFVGTPHPVTEIQVSFAARHSYEHERSLHRISWTTSAEQEIVAAFGKEPVGALILTGGDTAMFVLRALSARSIVLVGEIADGIPWGIIEGGLANDCLVITKSGGFGQPAALVEAFDFCERRVCETA